MPAIDYVSIVRSIYNDRRAMVLGGLACLLGVVTNAIGTGSPVMWAIAGGFVLTTIYRYIDMTMFARAAVGPTDVDAAAKWEVRATYGATMFAFLCGFWCFSSFVFVSSPSAEIISMVTTVGCMVGVVTRNFGLDRLITIQLAIAVTFIIAGLLLKDDINHWVLAALMLPMLVSFRFLAADVRKVLLASVHARVEASRLAVELDTALDTMQHALCMLDESGVIAITNDRAEQVFRTLAGGSWIGQPFSKLIETAAGNGAIPEGEARQLLDIAAGHGSGKVLLSIDERAYEVTLSSRNARTVALLEDITARVRAEERINFMAHYDSLTGLANRAYFTEQVESDLNRRRAMALGETTMLVMVDLDDFKHVNDTMGHLVGDQLLVEAADRLRGFSDLGLVSRFGGDEFVIYRRSVSAADAQWIPARILEAFKPVFQIYGQSFTVNVSLGVVMSSDVEDRLDALMTKADLALYKSKANGKAQSQVFHKEMDVEYRYRQRLKSELKLCLETGGLSLVYQPLIDLKTQRVVACEALARWHHAELGSISPAVFIPIAEETGLITEITRSVLEAATKECRSWPGNVSVSVNISARDFRLGDVPGMVNSALKRSGLDPRRLELEVTETALIEERDAATKILSELRRQGIGIALDDFGTGYSSLSYLQALPLSKVKVDRSFVKDITDNERSMTLLRNVAELGKGINLTVTAEGVETEAQLELIRQHTKVDQVQGFLFGIPLPRREVGELIARMEGVGRIFEQPASLVNAR